MPKKEWRRLQDIRGDINRIERELQYESKDMFYGEIQARKKVLEELQKEYRATIRHEMRAVRR